MFLLSAIDDNVLFYREKYCLQGFRFDTLGGALEHLPSSLGDLFSPVAFTICLQWLLFQIVLDRVLPGKVRTKTKRPSVLLMTRKYAVFASHVYTCARPKLQARHSTHTLARRSPSCRTYSRWVLPLGFGTPYPSSSLESCYRFVLLGVIFVEDFI